MITLREEEIEKPIQNVFIERMRCQRSMTERESEIKWGCKSGRRTNLDEERVARCIRITLETVEEILSDSCDYLQQRDLNILQPPALQLSTT